MDSILCSVGRLNGEAWITTSAHTLSAHTALTIQGNTEMGIELDHLIFGLEALTPIAKLIPEPIGGPLEGALEATCGILRYAKVRSIDRST